MIFSEYDLDSYIFKEPVHVFYTDRSQPLSAELKSMADLTDLMGLIKANDWQPGIGPFSIEMQLWFALARRTKFFEARP